MKARCTNPKKHNYPGYGGRGIRVCARWERFENFIADMGPRPSPKASIDRVDNDKGYCKSNCRWASRRQQQRNTRRTQWLTIAGVTRILTDWARLYGIRADTVRARLKRGLSPKRALEDPIRTY